MDWQCVPAPRLSALFAGLIDGVLDELPAALRCLSASSA